MKTIMESSTVTIKGGNNNFITYKIIEGTAFHEDTPEEVVKIINNILRSHRSRKIRIFLGNNKTGQDWCEAYDIFGHIGRSTGKIKIPILIKRQDSVGGTAILSNCIIKIMEDKKVIYQHPKYYLGELSVRDANKMLKEHGFFYSVFRDEENIANFAKKHQADNYILFLKGERNRK